MQKLVKHFHFVSIRHIRFRRAREQAAMHRRPMDWTPWDWTHWHCCPSVAISGTQSCASSSKSCQRSQSKITPCSRACYENVFYDWTPWISRGWRERCSGSFVIVWCLFACGNCNTCLQPYRNITLLAHLVPKCLHDMRILWNSAYCMWLCPTVNAWAHQPANIVSHNRILSRPI